MHGKEVFESHETWLKAFQRRVNMYGYNKVQRVGLSLSDSYRPSQQTSRHRPSVGRFSP
jgi:hypothetical protein